MENTLHKNNTLLFKKKTIIPLLGIIGGVFIFLSPIALFVVDKLRFARISVMVAGTVKSGFIVGKPMINSYIETAQGNYYLIDNTDEISRNQKATKVCPSGTISCYTAKQVRVKGYVTKKEWLMQSIVWPDTQIQDKVNRKPFKAEELVVLDFWVLE